MRNAYAYENPERPFLQTPAGVATAVGGGVILLGGILYLAFKPKESKAAVVVPGVTPVPGNPNAGIAWVPITSPEFHPNGVYRFSTYVLSKDTGAINNAAVGFTNSPFFFVIRQTWDAGQIPGDWPADDRDPNRWRFEVMDGGTSPIKLTDQNVKELGLKLYGAMPGSRV